MRLYPLVRPLLFRFDAETVHEGTLSLAAYLGRHAWGRHALNSLFAVDEPSLHTQVAGLDFVSPVGLAAGFDKNGRSIQALAAMGFGSVEIGSVSEHPSRGNTRPRLFRLPQDEAIVVNYGVPNDGAAAVAARLLDHPIPSPLGVNLVETNTGKPTDPDAVAGEFARAVRPFVGLADYIALNLNCPNTTGGVSPFADMGRLAALLQMYAAIDAMPPLFLKFTVHADPARIESFLQAVDPFPQVKGFIFNLPSGKNYPLQTPSHVTDPMPGTLCGLPVRENIDQALSAWYHRLDRSRHVLVGTGGIASAEDAYAKIRRGAALVQLYSALVFRGPGLLRRINLGLARLLKRDGFSSVSQAVGADHPA
jgi:dihydroorotate dehydrogenase